MATKNVIDEYFIKISADANAVNRDMTAALNKTFEKVKSMNKRLESLEKKIKGNTIKAKMDADKEYNVVQNNLRKNNLKQEEAALKREVDLAKVSYKDKNNLLKSHIHTLTNTNNIQLAKMKDYYKEQEILASKLSAKKKQELLDYNTVQRALDKRNEQREKDNLTRQEKLRAIKSKNDAARIRQHIKQQNSANNETLSNMRKFYQQQEKLAKKSYERIADIQQTDYFKRLQEADPVRSRQLRGDLREAANKTTLTGDASGIKNLATEMRRSTRSMQRNLNALAFTQNSVTDSTRNMIRSYISLFALFEGTRAIKNVGQDFQGIEASMLAAAGSSQSAAKDMMFINGIVDQMGLNLKSTTDAWVKFKFAAKGKITQGQQEDIFTGLSMFGTALKVDDESMKRSQKAIIQISNCLAA